MARMRNDREQNGSEGFSFKKILERIGIVEETVGEENEGPRYREESFEEPRYTPRSQARPSGARRPNAEGARPRAGASRYAQADAGSGYGYEDVEIDTASAKRDGRLRPKPTTIIYYLHSLSECSGVIDDLIAGNSVLLNLEETDTQLSQRVVDTLAGAAFALGAKIRKVSLRMYLIAPENVNVNETKSVNRRY